MAKTTKAAGPKPRTIPKAVPKVCGAGHSLHPASKPGAICPRCRDIAWAADNALSAAIERDGWDQVMGPPPDDMTMRTGTGEVVTYAIPRGLQLTRRQLQQRKIQRRRGRP